MGNKFQAVTRRKKIAIAASMIAIIAIAVYAIIYLSGSSKERLVEQTDKSIAVLPFEDRSENHDQEYFSDGVATEIINALAQASDLKVIARNSSFQFRGKSEDLRKVGEILGATAILQGSVRRSSDHVQITTQLTKASSGVLLWAKTFDGRPSAIFEIQAEIANAVVEALQVAISFKEESRQRNDEVHNLILQGKFLIAKGDRNSYYKGFNYLRQALKIDSEDAALWAMVAEACYIGSFRYQSDLLDSCRMAADRAIALNSSMAAPHITKGRLKRDFEQDFIGAVAEFDVAESLEPGNAELFKSRAQLEGNLGNFDNFVEFAKRAVELDPLSDYWGTLGVALTSNGQLEEAEQALKNMIQLRPEKGVTHTVLAHVYLIQGRFEEALQEVTKETEKGWRFYGLALVNHGLGRKEDSNANLDSLLTDQYAHQFAYELGEIYSFRGEADKAFEWLDKAYQLKDGALSRMKRSYFLKTLHHDPRWTVLLKKMKLPE